MKKRIAVLLILLISTGLFSGCSKAEEEELVKVKSELKNLSEQVTSMAASLEEKDKRLEEYESRLMELEAAKVNTEPTDIMQPLPGDEAKTPIKIADISLGYSKKLVESILGSDYKKETWEWLDEKQNEKWVYDNGITVKFYQDYVRSIAVSKPGIATDFGVQIGLDALSSISICEQRGMTPFTPVESENYVPIPGWYQSANDELLIMQFNDNGDRFNSDVDLSSTQYTITAYELENVSAYR